MLYTTHILHLKGAFMKKVIMALCVMGCSLMATDYSAMSATQLAAMRGSVPVEDRPAFQAAMQEKMQTMSQEERQALTQSRTSNPATGSMGSNAGGMGNGMGGGMGNGGRGGGRGGR